jgi:RNA polymerase sigma factor (sigma-70 family)
MVATTPSRRNSGRRSRATDDGSIVATRLDALDERERRIVELRFFDEMTQSQIAAEIGISQMHVSRLLRRALVKMRGRIEEVSIE